MSGRNKSNLVSHNRKLINLAEKISLVGIAIGSIAAAALNKTLFFFVPTFSFAFFSHLNRRYLEGLIAQYTLTFEAAVVEIEQSVTSIEEQLSEDRSSLIKAEQLSHNFAQIQEQLTQIESNSQNYLTKNQLNIINTRIKRINHKISDLEQDKENKLKIWLRSIGVIVYQDRKPDSINAGFKSIAKFLGNNYSKLSPLYQQMKQCLKTEQQLNFDLSTINNQDIVSFTGFCNLLKQKSFLSNYQYNKNTRAIQGELSFKGEASKFLDGGWFEIFVYQQITEFLQEKKIEFQFLINPIVQFPSGDKFELDLLFMIGDQPLWIECKTGNNYDKELSKYSGHRKLLSLEKENALIVGLNLSDLETEEKNSQSELTFANDRNLLYKIESLVLRA